MATGNQLSSATPRFAWTGTTPRGNTGRKKQIMEIMAAHRIPYAATACIAFPDDLMEKVKRATEFRGTRFLHLLSPCPTGWKMAEHISPKVARAAVETTRSKNKEKAHQTRMSAPLIKGGKITSDSFLAV